MSLSQNLPVYPPWQVQPMYTNLLSVLTLSPSSGGTHWPPWSQAHMLIVGLQVALAPLSSVATNDRLNYNKTKRLLWVVSTLFIFLIFHGKYRKALEFLPPPPLPLTDLIPDSQGHQKKISIDIVLLTDTVSRFDRKSSNSPIALF